MVGIKTKLHNANRIVIILLALCIMLSAFAFEARAEIATNGFIIATEADEGKAITVEELDASVVNASYKGNSNYKVVIPSGTTTIYVKFSSNTFSDATAYVGDYANTVAKRCISQSYKDTLTAKYTTPPGSIIAGQQYTVSSNYQDGWYAMPLTDLTATASIYPGIAFNSALNYACAMIWQLADNANVPTVNKAVNVLIQIGESGGSSLTDNQKAPLTRMQQTGIRPVIATTVMDTSLAVFGQRLRRKMVHVNRLKRHWFPQKARKTLKQQELRCKQQSIS